MKVISGINLAAKYPNLSCRACSGIQEPFWIPAFAGMTELRYLVAEATT